MDRKIIRENRVCKLHGSPKGGAFDFCDNLKPALSERDVLISINSASMNYRDLLVRRGLVDPNKSLIPLSDCAGTVTEIGDSVSRWKIGDRVMPSFCPNWHSGPFQSTYYESALGGGRDGILTDLAVFAEDELTPVPAHLTLSQASTLPCAAVTAWHALFERGRPLRKNDWLLVQGTGGVATFGLQFGVAVGAKVIVITSSDNKLQNYLKLGAVAGINYHTCPNWDDEVRRLTDGLGANHILEVGGPETFGRSLRCVKPGGTISLIGILTGVDFKVNLSPALFGNIDVCGVIAGSKEYVCRMTKFLEEYRIEPIIDRTFLLEDIESAYSYLESGNHCGKVVIDLSSRSLDLI
jgi:NADPH:quinone reductase-like Zn-dependent oxidoreductase